MSKEGLSSVDTVADVLEGYASRGVYRGFSREPVGKGKAVFKILWHRDRSLELILEAHSHTIRLPMLLPDADASMCRELGRFLRLRHSPKLPEHRRVDLRKACIRCSHRRGGIAVSLTVKDRDYEYGTRKLSHVVNEIFMVFLSDGRYRDYVVKTFHLEPDAA